MLSVIAIMFPRAPGTAAETVTTPAAADAIISLEINAVAEALIAAASAAPVAVASAPILNSLPVAPEALAVNVTPPITQVSAATGKPEKVNVADALTAAESQGIICIANFFCPAAIATHKLANRCKKPRYPTIVAV